MIRYLNDFLRRASDAAGDGRFWLPHGPALQRDGGSR